MELEHIDNFRTKFGVASYVYMGIPPQVLSVTSTDNLHPSDVEEQVGIWGDGDV